MGALKKLSSEVIKLSSEDIILKRIFLTQELIKCDQLIFKLYNDSGYEDEIILELIDKRNDLEFLLNLLEPETL